MADKKLDSLKLNMLREVADLEGVPQGAYSIRVDGEGICEPFNIYYELGICCIPKCKQWDLNLILTNSRHFEIERHYQPSFAIDTWWYPNDKFALQFGVNYKPAGIFNISSEFYQLYANIGVCYKW